MAARAACLGVAAASATALPHANISIASSGEAATHMHRSANVVAFRASHTTPTSAILVLVVCASSSSGSLSLL